MWAFSDEHTFSLLPVKNILIFYWETIAFSIQMTTVGLSLHSGSRGGICPWPNSPVCFTLFCCDWLKKGHMMHITHPNHPWAFFWDSQYRCILFAPGLAKLVAQREPA